MKYVFKDRGNRLPPVKLSGAGAVLGKADPKDILKIVTDTREQNPLRFEGGYVVSSVGTVPVFDYALLGDETNYALERKSIGDFVASVSISKNWIRELEKIKKAKEWNLPIVIICEFSFDDIRKYDYSIFSSGAITSQFIYRRVAQLIYEYNVHVVFAGSRTGGAYAVALLLKRRHEHLHQESLKINKKRHSESYIDETISR